MRQYDGAVLFVDILGIGALTRGLVPLNEEAFEPWQIDDKGLGQHYMLAARLLTGFRKILVQAKENCEPVKIAQLSDCAFIWSEDPIMVANAARDIMWETSRAGILCRGGLAHGAILEPDKLNHSLGEFVLGEAVTKAVSLEGSGKGFRVFCDTNVAAKVSAKCHFYNSPFIPLRNPLNGTVVDEFQWYTLPETISTRNYVERRDELVASALARLLAHLRHSPLFLWNSSSTDGLIQVACSVESVSNALQRVLPNGELDFSAEQMMYAPPQRSEKIAERVTDLFQQEVSKKGSGRTTSTKHGRQ